MGSKEFNHFFGCHVVSIASASRGWPIDPISDAFSLHANTHSPISLSWPACKFLCFRPIRIGRTWASWTLDLLIHDLVRPGRCLSWSLCPTGGTLFFDPTAPWVKGLPKTSPRRPALAKTKVSGNNIFLGFPGQSWACMEWGQTSFLFLNSHSIMMISRMSSAWVGYLQEAIQYRCVVMMANRPAKSGQALSCVLFSGVGPSYFGLALLMYPVKH